MSDETIEQRVSAKPPADDSPLPLSLLRDVEVEVTLEIGRKRMRIADVLRVTKGSTIELSKFAGEPLEILVNGQLLGRGEAIVVGDRYGVRITELVGRPSDIRGR
jgi:flagellar motor switch protein FliN/FliY